MLRSVVQGAGGDPDRVKETTIGFEAVKALLAKRVAAATAFWNVEGVALKAKRPAIREFRVDRYGAPSYPELVLCVTRETLQDKPALVRATIRALQRGYAQTQNDPESAVSTMLEAESRASTAPTWPPSSTPSRPSSPPARPSSASCGRRCCARGRRGTRSSGS